MGKIWVEICLISARGLKRKSPLWKFQWFGVAWIDPDKKYCTKIDASGNGSPVWKTKFSTAVDAKNSNIEDLALHVEVYSREPFFLGQSLLGTTKVVLKEFLDKYVSNSEISKPVEEVGSFQLRKRKSDKPQGFVDISIRVSEEREEDGSVYSGGPKGLNLTDQSGGINLVSGYGSLQSHRPQFSITTSHQPESRSHHMPIPPNYANHSSIGGPNYPAASGPSYRQPLTPPPRPPPYNVGYVPTFLPRTENVASSSYINMPSSSAPPGHGGGPGFGMGLGAGALAAGAVIFGEDFMSGFDFPGGLGNASVTISSDPPL